MYLLLSKLISTFVRVISLCEYIDMMMAIHCYIK